MLDRGLLRCARLRDFTPRRGGGGLHRARRAGNIVIGGDHRLGGLLQMAEVIGLARYPAGDLLQVPRDVGELDPKRADPAGKLIDQTFAWRRSGCSAFQWCELRYRHRCFPAGLFEKYCMTSSCEVAALI